MKVYLNSILDGTTNYAGTPNTDNTAVEIGRLNGAMGVRQFMGNIDDVRIYNRALSGPEVLALYNRGLGCVP